MAARVIGNGTASSAQVVFIDRGSTSGIEKGMAVVTPDGIVGKVIAVYPLASQVLLVTDPTFAVGVESQKGAHPRHTCSCNGVELRGGLHPERREGGSAASGFTPRAKTAFFRKGFPVGTRFRVKSGAVHEGDPAEPKRRSRRRGRGAGGPARRASADSRYASAAAHGRNAAAAAAGCCRRAQQTPKTGHPGRQNQAAI